MIPIEYSDRTLLNNMLAANTLFVPATHVFRTKPYVLGTFGAGDVQTTRDPLWFLTDRDCVDTGMWTPQVFAHDQAACQPGFPLTQEEAHFIAPGVLALERYPTDLFMGYSAWWQRRKWYCPLLEYCYEPLESYSLLHELRVEPLADRNVLRAFVRSEAERLFLALQGSDEGTVLLDLDSARDRFRLYLCVPVAAVCTRYSSRGEWQRHLAALFPYEEGALGVGTPVYIDDASYAQDRHPDGCACADHNANLESFGCSVYDLSSAPASARDDESFRKWLGTRQALTVAWAPGKDAARHAARLYCERLGYQPLDPSSRQPLPREQHILPVVSACPTQGRLNLLK